MKKNVSVFFVLIFSLNAFSQVEPDAGKWHTWFIPSAKAYQLKPGADISSELSQVIQMQKKMNPEMMEQILYWNAGSPGYRWVDMMGGLWMSDTGYNGALANMLLSVAIYDATVTAWGIKYTVKRPRPFEADKKIKAFVPNPHSPSYPCEHAVTAGVAVTIISHFFPEMADSVRKLSAQMMQARIASGLAFPSDTKDGFTLGQQIALKEIEATRSYPNKERWDGKRPEGPLVWKGMPMSPLVGRNKTVLLDSSSQFRPAPPPDFAKDMEELKKFKPTFRSMANAFYFASESFWDEALNKKIFEYNIHLNPPAAARLYAISAMAMYDGFTACWDAKYTYWGTRPDQYDTTYHPVLFFTPPFPGYPSGHAMLGRVMAEVYSDFFPADQAYFRKRAKDGAESRFQGGIHFRTDNEVGLEMGKKVGAAIIQKVKAMERQRLDVDH
jgi:membrane-associated phospholipid phosphatase